MADTIAPVDVVTSTDYILPVTHASVERVGMVVRLTMAMQQTGCKSVGLSALTTPEVAKSLLNLRTRLVESSPAVKAAMALEVPALPGLDFDFEAVALPQFIINAQAYAVEERGAIFIDLYSADPAGQIKTQAFGGVLTVGIARVAMGAGMFLAWNDALEKALD